MALNNSQWFGSTAGFYNGVATQSLRFNDNDTASLSWSPSSAGNRKKWTFSTWLKRSTITNASSGDQYIFSQATGSNNNDSFIALIFRGDDLDVTCHSLEVLRSDAKFRDVGAWYHILWVLDTENSTASHRMRLYVNGDEITSFSTDNRSNSQLDGTNMPILNNATHYIGRYGGDTSRNFDGYLAYTELVEGEALTPSSFTEEKNGVLIPIEYTGDHGTYGFRLEYKQTGDGSSSASSSTIGADTKSNATKQHWNDNNLDAYDSNMPDSPENNFTTLNSINGYTVTLSEGNLKYTVANPNPATSTISIPTTGKWYWEVYVSAVGEGTIGVQNRPNVQSNGFSGRKTTYYREGGSGGGSGSIYIEGTGYGGSQASYTNGDVISVLYNADDMQISWYKNGSQQGSTYSVTDTDVTPIVWQASGSGSTSGIFNFGQDSTFAGAISAGGNSDANGRGDFAYAVPTGFLALCSANLPEPTIGPNSATQADDHFNTVLFSGTGSSPLSVPGVGFQPDWLWLKRRDSATNGHHILYDSIRGVTNALRASNNTAESQFGDMVITFASDGFSFTGTDGLNNSSSYSNVAWNWLGNGTTPTKTYKVVVVSDSGNKYRFRNSADSATFAQSAVTLDLQEGGTYTFDLSDSSMSGHPFVLSTTSNGTHGGGSEYTTNVTKTGTAGSAGASIVITIASSAPTLYYYCSNHSGMGGQINTNTTFGSTNFDGSTLSVTNANITSGFSIVKYEATGSAMTVGHGLSKAPDFMIVKSADQSGAGWVVYYGDNTDYLSLEGNGATIDGSSTWNDTSPTNAVFSVGVNGGDSNNTAGGTMIGYMFHNVEGFSKVGSYTGNGSTDGTFVYLGFRPAWVLIKRTDTSSNWIIYDNTRDPFNDDGTQYLFANLTNAEPSDGKVDFVSNGFKQRSPSSYTDDNASGGTYIYMAFAEQTFKFANAR